MKRKMTLFVLLFTAFCLMAAGPACAQESTLPALDSAENALGQVLGLEPDNPYIQTVNITHETEDGILVRLDQALVEKDGLTLSFVISGDLPERLGSVHFDQTELLIDGEYPKAGYSSTGTFYQVKDQPGQYVSMDIFNFDLPLPDTETFKISYTITGISIYSLSSTGVTQEYQSDTEMEFAFDARRNDALTQDTLKIESDFTFDYDGNQLTVKEFRASPVGTALILHCADIQKSYPQYYFFDLDSGERIPLFLSSAGSVPDEPFGKGHVLYQLNRSPYEPTYPAALYQQIQASKTLRLIPVKSSDVMNWWKSGNYTEYAPGIVTLER